MDFLSGFHIVSAAKAMVLKTQSHLLSSSVRESRARHHKLSNSDDMVVFGQDAPLEWIPIVDFLLSLHRLRHDRHVVAALFTSINVFFSSCLLF